MDGLGDVVGLNGFCGVEIGDGAGDFQDAVIGAGTKIQITHGGAEDLFGSGFHPANLMKGFAAHVGIAVGAGLVLVALLLDFPGTDYTLANG